MTIEKQLTTQFAKTATKDANQVNYLVGFLRLIWASTFILTAYMCFLDDLILPAIILATNGMLTFKTIQNLIFNTYGGYKIAIQYCLLLIGVKGRVKLYH